LRSVDGERVTGTAKSGNVELQRREGRKAREAFQRLLCSDQQKAAERSRRRGAGLYMRTTIR
jgi:hypothetical protein